MSLTRSALFHPAFFYPMLAVTAAALVYLSLRPDLLPGPAQPAAGRADQTGALVLEGRALSRPEGAPNQSFHIQRDGLGRPEALRIAVAPNQPAPGPADRGVRVLISPEAAARFASQPVRIEVVVRPLPITTATGLALSWQGDGPVEWRSRTLTPQAQTIAFDLPAQAAPEAVGLRVISANNDYRYGFEIARIRVTPHNGAAPP